VQALTPGSRPQKDEAAPYYFRYIERVPEGPIVDILAAQLDEALPFLEGISEERSLFRYAPDKWSIRQVVNHVSDTERLFLFRALWFARGFDAPLPSYDQDVSAGMAEADRVGWAAHVEELRSVRLASLTLLRAEAWPRRGVASGNPFSVRSLAYIAAGHLAHHLAILRERYA
jgi:DinB superfamily